MTDEAPDPMKLRDDINHLAVFDPSLALRVLRTFEELLASEPWYVLWKPGTLIDLGSSLDDLSLIIEAVEALEILVDQDNPEHASEGAWLLFCLGNGYELIATASMEPAPHDPSLQKAKFAFRRAIDRCGSSESSELKARLLCNYGNLLAKIGRHYEALKSYDRALTHDPNHSMSLGNKAIELSRFAHMTGTQSGAVLAEALHLATLAAKDESLERSGHRNARAIFQTLCEELQPIVESSGISLDEIRAQTINDESMSITEYEFHHHEFAQKNDLFLNLCVHEWSCPIKSIDVLYFDYIVTNRDPYEANPLFRYFNQAKEDFALARWTLGEAMRSIPSRDRISAITRYVDLLEYADNGLRSGQAKSSLAIAFNILDKISVFLAMNLGLSVNLRSVSFRSVWYEGNDHRKGVVRQEILEKNDPNLFALLDMARDLESGNGKQWVGLRNAITHHHLVVHDWILHVGEYSEASEHIHFDRLVLNSIELLQFVKSALIYLASYLSQELLKRESELGLVLPLPYFWQEFGVEEWE